MNSNTATKLIFKVKDTGIGIQEEKLGTLFDIFSQIDDSYTKRYQGAGLGLTLAKNLVESMGAKMTDESIAGEGSTFVIELPLMLSY